MALAYAVIMVSDELLRVQRTDTLYRAQQAADEKFGKMAEEARLTRVTRNPEPRVMTPEELHNAFIGVNLEGLTGLYFTADITA